MSEGVPGQDQEGVEAYYQHRRSKAKRGKEAPMTSRDDIRNAVASSNLSDQAREAIYAVLLLEAERDRLARQ